MENGIFYFKFEILAVIIGQSQILKNICQQLLSLNNVLRMYLIFLILHFWIALVKTFQMIYNLVGFSEVHNFPLFLVMA